ncbi:endonuclease/exonuclease/phosphatase family protein [Wukongibacter baidiensis]|uniref:endonuclease/exonuclease/phosphatase family protein n=1 Tax=Wukongibacter baidiensis TaxID=1723361 RepID=UPI003D7FD888
MSSKRFRRKRLSIITWNIYFGADLNPLINTTPEEVPEAVTEVFNQFKQTNFPARAKSIAKQICKARPDIICLQEVAVWTVQSPTSLDVIDFLDILLGDLKKLGLDYNIVAINRNFKSRLPSSTDDMIGILDRDVILTSSKSPLKFSNIQESNFETNLVVPVGGQPFTVLRGWSSVDICLYNQKFRLVNTHLEANSTEIRFAQANELLNGPGVTDLPLLFIGDFNSDAESDESPTYDLLIESGFTDAWDIEGRGPGFTSAQARNLLNPISTLSERIDLILFRDSFDVKRINRVGDRQRDRTPCGLWPSDHAGVVAKLKFHHCSHFLESSSMVETE